MAGAVSTVLLAYIRDIPTQFGWTGFVNSMQWLIGLNAVVWTDSLAILGLIFYFTFGYQLAVQYKVTPDTADFVTLGTLLNSLPQNFTHTLLAGLAKGAVKNYTDADSVVSGKDVRLWGFFNFGKFFGAYGFFTVMHMGAIAATI